MIHIAQIDHSRPPLRTVRNAPERTSPRAPVRGWKHCSIHPIGDKRRIISRHCWWKGPRVRLASQGFGVIDCTGSKIPGELVDPVIRTTSGVDKTAVPTRQSRARWIPVNVTRSVTVGRLSGSCRNPSQIGRVSRARRERIINNGNAFRRNIGIKAIVVV